MLDEKQPRMASGIKSNPEAINKVLKKVPGAIPDSNIASSLPNSLENDSLKLLKRKLPDVLVILTRIVAYTSILGK